MVYLWDAMHISFAVEAFLPVSNQLPSPATSTTIVFAVLIWFGIFRDIPPGQGAQGCAAACFAGGQDNACPADRMIEKGLPPATVLECEGK